MSLEHSDLFDASGALLALTLERMVAGELQLAEQAVVERHLASHPPDQARLEEVQQHEARFRAAPIPSWLSAAGGGAGLRPAEPPDLLPPAVDPAPLDTRQSANDSRGWQGLIVALAAAALVFVMVPGGGQDVAVDLPQIPDRGSFIVVDEVPASGLRPKGAALELGVFREDGQRLHVGSTVVPGERLGFQVRSAEAGYLAIVGLDAAGTAWAGYPQGSTEAAAVASGEALVDLSTAIRLDDQGSHERLIAVRCGESFSMGELQALVVQAAYGHASDTPLSPVRADCAQDEVLVSKAAAG